MAACSKVLLSPLPAPWSLQAHYKYCPWHWISASSTLAASSAIFALSTFQQMINFRAVMLHLTVEFAILSNFSSIRAALSSLSSLVQVSSHPSALSSSRNDYTSVVFNNHVPLQRRRSVKECTSFLCCSWPSISSRSSVMDIL